MSLPPSKNESQQDKKRRAMAAIDSYLEECAKLLCCPFCGGEAQAGFLDASGLYHVECDDCPGATITDTEDKAIAAWNRRVEATELEDARAWEKGG